MNNNFNFELILNHSMKTFQIQPPMSFQALIEIAQERFDLTKIFELLVEEEEIKISSESDYFDFLNWAESSNLKEIELLIKSTDSKAKRKKSTTFRKASFAYKPVSNNYSSYVPDGETINDHFNEEYESDIRNKKYMMEEGLYNKHSNKVTEQNRIYHICEKKERLKREQIERELERAKTQKVNPNINEDGILVDQDFGKKNKNKGKKGKKKNKNADSDDEN